MKKKKNINMSLPCLQEKFSFAGVYNDLVKLQAKSVAFIMNKLFSIKAEYIVRAIPWLG